MDEWVVWFCLEPSHFTWTGTGADIYCPPLFWSRSLSRYRAQPVWLHITLKLIVCSSDIIRQSGSATGSMEMTFQLKKYKKDEKRQQLNQDHHRERRKIRRSAGSLKPEHRKGTSKFWMGKRVYWPPHDIMTLHINSKLCGCLFWTIPWEIHRSTKSIF